MRKLLSLLAISAIVGYTSVNTISCNKKATTNNKVDISKQTFNPIIYNNNKDIYDNIRAQMGKWVNPAVSGNEIKMDSNNIDIKLYESDGNWIHENDNITVDTGNNYIIKIMIKNKNNNWFKQTNSPVTYNNISLTFNKISIANRYFEDKINYSTNKDVYNSVRSQIASWSDLDINANDIKNDDDIGISIYQKTTSTNEDDQLVDEYATLAVDATKSSNSYYVKINVDENDLYFQAMAPQNYDITLIFNKVDISQKTFQPDLAKTPSDAYNSVWNQIADWIDVENVDGTTIKNDLDITLTNKDSGKTIDPNDTTTPIASGTYNVSINDHLNNAYISGIPSEEGIIIRHISDNAVKMEIKPNPNDPNHIYDELYDISNSEIINIGISGTYNQWYLVYNKDKISNPDFKSAFLEYDETHSKLYFISDDKTQHYATDYAIGDCIGLKEKDSLTNQLTITLEPSGYGKIGIKEGDKWSEAFLSNWNNLNRYTYTLLPN